ncbi:MAG: DUF6879 family protein [Micromonosporaceae bacterium]
MELLQDKAFEGLFRRFRRTAFHLEVQDSYQTPEETGPFQLFLTGQPDDLAWHRPWLDLVRGVTSSGKSIKRVRVVSTPHGDYTRWGLWVAPHNIAAGEEIRWLPRHLLEPGAVTADDYWLFDDDTVAFTVFEPGGRFAGGAVTEDREIVTYCRAVRDRVWSAAIPHDEYVASAYVTT